MKINQFFILLIAVSVATAGRAQESRASDSLSITTWAVTDFLSGCTHVNSTSRHLCEATKAVIYGDIFGTRDGLSIAYSRLNSAAKDIFREHVSNSSSIIEASSVIANTALSASGLGDRAWNKALRGLTNYCETTCPANYTMADCSANCAWNFLYLGTASSTFSDTKTLGIINENAGYEFGKSLFHRVNTEYGEMPALISSFISTALLGKAAYRFGDTGRSLFIGLASSTLVTTLPILDRLFWNTLNVVFERLPSFFASNVSVGTEGPTK